LRYKEQKFIGLNQRARLVFTNRAQLILANK